uniref:AT-rich interactive domain-containing protein 2 n=1 Tax=Kalanchoe fedtschenkoi TaxID=63787 RepID=A0A7N0T379_KALFE
MGLMHAQDHGCEQDKKKHLPIIDGYTCNGHKPIFGPSTNMGMLMSLKRLAINPFSLIKEPEIRKYLFDQVLKVREGMIAANATTSQRKRKLPQLTKSNINEDSGFASKRFDHRNSKKVKGFIEVSSPASCTPDLEVRTTQVFASCTGPKLTNFVILEDKCRQNLGNRHSSRNSSQSGPGSNHQSSEVPSFVEVLPCEDDETVIDLGSSIYNDSKQCPIPAGPRFQADIPEYRGPIKFDSHFDNVDSAGDLRWLGTRFWPVEGKTTNVCLNEVGIGRNENCSCLSPGSTECVSQHIVEQKLKLQFELGSTFQSWRFDDMGEAITESWTTKEHKAFNSLVKKSMLPNGVNYWEHASKCFPGKSYKDLTQYYLNVFIPRRIGLWTRLSCKSIDTDDNEDVDESKRRRKCKGESPGLGKSGYLRGR